MRAGKMANDEYLSPDSQNTHTQSSYNRAGSQGEQERRSQENPRSSKAIYLAMSSAEKQKTLSPRQKARTNIWECPSYPPHLYHGPRTPTRTCTHTIAYPCMHTHTNACMYVHKHNFKLKFPTERNPTLLNKSWTEKGAELILSVWQQFIAKFIKRKENYG